LSRCNDVKDALKALASIVGIDIQQDNVEESRRRLMDMFFEKYGSQNEVATFIAGAILRNNIICGDSLEIMKIWEKK
jgi:hypothetical protein